MESQPSCAIIYARFSPRPDPEEAKSIEHQLRRCRAYCEQRGWPVRNEYMEPGVSGKNTKNRPQLMAALEECCTYSGILVCYSLSRLARNTRDALAIVDMIHGADAALSILDCNVDTTSPMGRMFFTIMAAFYEFERRCISKRTSDAMLDYQEQGRRMSSRCPFGYMKDPADPKRVIECPEEQATLKRILELRAGGASLLTIERHLVNEGLMGRSGKPMERMQIWRACVRAGVLGNLDPTYITQRKRRKGVLAKA